MLVQTYQMKYESDEGLELDVDEIEECKFFKIMINLR